MKAYKCDRCGKLYEYYDGIELVSGGYKFTIFSISNYFGIANEDYDLCPECMKSLIKWIKEGRQ